MPGRQSHGSAPVKKSKTRTKTKKRGLDAFAIASKLDGDAIKVKRHRLGVLEGDDRPAKRRRGTRDEDGEEEDDDEDGDDTRSRRRPAGSDEEVGSDSDGNEWRMGHVDDDDDSEIDSDEAFGESDEEKYSGFSYKGSKAAVEKRRKKLGDTTTRSVTLDEDEDLDMHEEDEDGTDSDDLGEDAIDLAAMLDATEEDAEESKNQVPEEDEDEEEQEDDDEDQDDSEDSVDGSLFSESDDEDETDPSKIAALQSLIANLSQPKQETGSKRKAHNHGNEHHKPSTAGLVSKTKLTLEDLSLPNIQDPHIKNSLKYLDSNTDGKASRKVQKKLAVPLAKRQQDRLDRQVAYDKTKETLARWTDTVAHNRRADHLIFPLQDPGTASTKSNTTLLPTGQTKPFNDLEATIQSILQDSGLAPSQGKDDEDHLREMEDLEASKLSMDEVRARRDQLRMARELLYREEARAKRIKKIKSKAYRKVHRKQREKEERLNKEALAEGGYVASEDEQEAQDRRRAEERMGQRHRGSKWAKSAKASGKAAWDEDTRSGMTELARRDEELRRRVDGKTAHMGEGSESDYNDDDATGSDSDAERRHLVRQVDGLEATAVDKSIPGAGLANMKFMLRAEESRKKANDAMLKGIQRDLQGQESESEPEAGDVGRRTYGPASTEALKTKVKPTLRDFEESLPSDEEDGDRHMQGRDEPAAKKTRKPVSILKNASAPPARKVEDDTGAGAWSRTSRFENSITTEGETRKRKQRANDAMQMEDLDLTQAAILTKPRQSGTKRSTILGGDASEDDSVEDDEAIQLPFAVQHQDLIKRAFAGADVVGEFEAEKRQTIAEDDDKVVDNTLPGWGSWVGNGVSKRDRTKHKGRFLTTVKGVQEKDRKDAKLQSVIISEKRVKKVCQLSSLPQQTDMVQNVKYLASALPHEFETKQQYERSLRLPVGPEWVTKETFQEATKPRILLKQGIITPMSKPLF